MNSTPGRNYAIDAKRVRGNQENDRDPDAPDALWVPVVSTDREECISTEAKIDVLRYVTQMGRGEASGIDASDGPRVDTGDSQKPRPDENDAMKEFSMSADEYLRQAALQKISASRGTALQYIAYHRVRRPSLV